MSTEYCEFHLECNLEAVATSGDVGRIDFEQNCVGGDSCLAIEYLSKFDRPNLTESLRVEGLRRLDGARGGIYQANAETILTCKAAGSACNQGCPLIPHDQEVLVIHSNISES